MRNTATATSAHVQTYVECGGQVNDQGTVTIGNVTYVVKDLAKVGEQFKPAIAVKVAFPAGTNVQLKEGDVALCQVDAQARANTVKNHTATHMLQAALIQVLGPQVKQAGSVVTPDYLRFDFSHHQPLTDEQVAAIETLVNDKIQQDIATDIHYATLEQAKAEGVIAFFGEKYNPEQVRVVKIPGFSAELCGGTHASSTGIIGCFKITSETALAAGTRRIVAVTGPEALKLFQQSFSATKKLGELFKVKPELAFDAVTNLQEQSRQLQTQLRQARKQLLELRIPALAAQAQTVNGVHLLVANVPDLNAEELRTVAQELDKLVKGLVVVSTQQGASADQVSLVAQAHSAVQGKFSVKDLGEHLKTTCGFRGGGSASSIQGGGPRQTLGNIEAVVRTFVQDA